VIFANFAKLPRKTELPEKRGFRLMEMRRAERFLSLGQAPFIN